MADEEADKVVPLKQVAIILGVSPKTVSRWCKEGKLAHFRTLGGHRRVYMQEVKRILDARAQQLEDSSGS